MHAPHHEGRARPSLFVLINILSRWRPSIPFFRKPIAWRRAHAMAQELRDPTTSHQETSLVWAQTAPEGSSGTCAQQIRQGGAGSLLGSGVSTGLFFVRAHDARVERQAEGAVEVIELGPLTVLV